MLYIHSVHKAVVLHIIIMHVYVCHVYSTLQLCMGIEMYIISSKASHTPCRQNYYCSTLQLGFKNCLCFSIDNNCSILFDLLLC